MQRQRLTSASVEASAAGRMPLDLEAVAYEELGETPQLRKDAVLELRKLNHGAWNPEVYSLNVVFRAGVVIGEYCLLDERTQIAGVVGIVALKELGFEHVRHYTPSVIKKSIQLGQDCYPMRMKAIYIINNPPIIEVIYSNAKLSLKQKLVDMIHFIGRGYEKLHELTPREQLPEEYGGTLNNYNYDAFERGLRSTEEFFVELSEYGYRKQKA